MSIEYNLEKGKGWWRIFGFRRGGHAVSAAGKGSGACFEANELVYLDHPANDFKVCTSMYPMCL